MSTSNPTIESITDTATECCSMLSIEPMKLAPDSAIPHRIQPTKVADVNRGNVMTDE